MQEWIRQLHVSFPRFCIPRRSYLVIVLNDVLVGSIECDCERCAGAARCSFESIVSRDQIIGENAAVTPATNAETIRISDAHLDHMIDACQEILNLEVAPICKNRA